MPDMERLKTMAVKAGFTCAGPLDVSTVRLLDEVRAMCAANRCGAYGRNWSCPPACGEIGDLRQIVAGYRVGLLVQTVGEVEDEFDGEGMMRFAADHGRHFNELHALLLDEWPGLLALGAGACTRCARCTFPDAPCRFPEKRVSSMEAFGILVTDVCLSNGLRYYYGPGTIAYTGCFLLE